MPRFWNFEETGTERTLYLEGYIAQESWFDDEVSPREFKNELERASGDITVWINSPGGDFFAASQIYTMLKEYKGQVTVKIDGIAASAAAVIAMAGDKVLMSPTVKEIRKLKDGQGQYLWQPSVTAGEPDTILNRPVKTSAYAPTIEAGAKVIAFGDFGYYWIADRQGRAFQRLNELYAATGHVGFKATQRVDGKLILKEAVKILKIKA
jgi:hypothetical protein